MFIEICGVTSEEDALLAVALGADAVTFVFAPSPRQVQPTYVKKITDRLPPDVMTIGVFRNELPERVIEIAHNAGVRAVRVEGHERPEDIAALKASIPYVIKGFAADDPELKRADEYGADIVNVSSPHDRLTDVLTWSRDVDLPRSIRKMISGGLTPGNIAAVIDGAKPFGVEVVSGVEASVGKMDPRKMRTFIATARIAASSYDEKYESDEPAPFDWDA